MKVAQACGMMRPGASSTSAVRAAFGIDHGGGLRAMPSFEAERDAMSINAISAGLAVSPQRGPGDIAAARFRPVNRNRPDGEGPGQPDLAETGAAAREMAPAAARNLPNGLGVIQGAAAVHDGRGGCPSTTERARIVPVRSNRGGKRLADLPTWPPNERKRPPIRGKAVLRGRERAAKPRMAG